jgi:group I intron endonuclease
MAYIYQITNDINGKIYVGKTERSIEERFKEHCKDSKRREFEKRPLYRAMNKYGTEHFHIELLEETDKPEESEIYWIEQKRSFKNGYNATLGGEGTRYIDYDLVIATYKEVQNQNEVARRLNISADTVHSVLKNNHIDTIPSSTAAAVATGKIVNQYDLQGNYIQSFLSSKAAAESLGKITATSNGASSHISEVCRGKRKTAYGFIWKFAE